jgi:uncharacterized protein with GYD domain
VKFISLIRFKTKPTKASIAQNIKCIKHVSSKEGVKCIGYYYTLGRYDAVLIMEAPDEKAVLRASLRRGDCMSIETLVAIPAEEARKLIKK